MVFVSFIISYAFYTQFTLAESPNDDEQQIGKVYVIIGFEVSNIMF